MTFKRQTGVCRSNDWLLRVGPERDDESCVNEQAKRQLDASGVLEAAGWADLVAVSPACLLPLATAWAANALRCPVRNPRKVAEQLEWRRIMGRCGEEGEEDDGAAAAAKA